MQPWFRARPPRLTDDATSILGTERARSPRPARPLRPFPRAYAPSIRERASLAACAVGPPLGSAPRGRTVTAGLPPAASRGAGQQPPLLPHPPPPPATP